MLSRRMIQVSRKFVAVLTASSIFLISICFAEPSIEDNPHHFQLSCDKCHELADNSDDVKNTVGPVFRDINKACQSGCHNFDSPLNHPVGIRPNSHTPSDMPLDSRGQITCLTCHDELNRSSDIPAYLRRAQGREFCGSCHQNAGSNTKKRSHWQFSTKAHLDTGNPGASSENFREITGGIDRESYTCLSCHDEVSVVIPGENETRHEKMLRWKKMTDHPIGMTYATKASRKSYDYNSPIMLDKSIRFFDGRMGCGTCHNLYSRRKNNLTLPFDRGVLCRQCHIR